MFQILKEQCKDTQTNSAQSESVSGRLISSGSALTLTAQDCSAGNLSNVSALLYLACLGLREFVWLRLSITGTWVDCFKFWNIPVHVCGVVYIIAFESENTWEHNSEKHFRGMSNLEAEQDKNF